MARVRDNEPYRRMIRSLMPRQANYNYTVLVSECASCHVTSWRKRDDSLDWSG